jgi:hypothetical protein
MPQEYVVTDRSQAPVVRRVVGFRDVTFSRFSDGQSKAAYSSRRISYDVER